MSILLVGVVKGGLVGEGKEASTEERKIDISIPTAGEEEVQKDASQENSERQERDTTISSNGDIVWTGEWYFAKNNINSKEFLYRRISDSVPKNILDYVSFTTSSSHPNPRPRGRKKLKLRDSSSSTTTIEAIPKSDLSPSSGEVAEVAAVAPPYETEIRKDLSSQDIETPEEPVIPQIPIPRRHPLFGLWEGSFKVSNPKGPDEEIAETFFICSFNGERGDEISAAAAVAVAVDPMSRVKSETTTSNFTSSSTSSESILPDDFSELPPDPRWTLAYSRALQSETEDANVNPNANTNVNANETTNKEEEGKESVANDTTGLSKDIIMLVGFGCNVYGRFSLAAAYNSVTRIWKCEKKYMLSKFVGRPRKHPHQSQLPADQEYISMATRHRTNSTGSIIQNDKSADDDEVHEIGKIKRRKSVSSEDYYEGGKGKTTDLTGGDESTFEEGGVEGDLDQDGFRSAFYDEESGEIYEGGWVGGTRHGKGVCLSADGTLYEGSWIGGKEHGYGIWMTGERQIIFSGEWVEGKMQGTGTYYFPNGDIYIGEWKEGLRHGKGQYTLKDGTSYSGDWRENLRHGRGIMTWNDGSVYEGEFDRGSRHGRGELRLSDGFIYSGSWDTNYMEGRGTSVFPDGQEYQGMFKKGLREGRGSITFAEGAVYEGRFREDAMDGQGTVKITRALPGALPGEVFIPFEIQADIRRIHYRAGFGADSH